MGQPHWQYQLPQQYHRMHERLQKQPSVVHPAWHDGKSVALSWSFAVELTGW